jgi:hypothetical protein
MNFYCQETVFQNVPLVLLRKKQKFSFLQKGLITGIFVREVFVYLSGQRREVLSGSIRIFAKKTTFSCTDKPN